MLRTEPKMKTCAEPGCENQFRPRFKTTERFCSSQCAYNHRKRQEASKPKKKHYIKPRTEKRSKQERLYSAKRIEFLSRKENKFCAVYPNQRATQVHHKKGRIGDLLTDERYWLAVSSDGHEYIENNPIEAKEKGWSLSRLSKDENG